jgi:(S)-citramalyl-CoA lyase
MTAIADRLATSSSLRSRLRACRSFLLTPGAHPEHFAGARQGDGIIVDLESSVPPTEKDKAREAALAYLGRPIDADLVRILRINSPRTVDGMRDLLALHESGVHADALIIPKCESPDEVGVVADVLDGAQSTIGILPMIELARAVLVA